ncbi:hypothetical protein PA0598 [Candidatus Phytoplasma australiense]|uniref:Uncharacterized protein n=2 Tax=Phytoplasma australiense TaxID=59748 RepID=B1VAF9_PHYAS|nr:hypothetical protein [Candidatus Phytoplasma australiense]AGL90319.1 Hypothetical Protein SLY_0399 [Strawberry lethal yellows phytoplasma (CPA) str. NZSb11]CAM11932.1 hypothetical protein PA0598 [Candidatus Phytoplasma australiense]
MAAKKPTKFTKNKNNVVKKTHSKKAAYKPNKNIKSKKTKSLVLLYNLISVEVFACMALITFGIYQNKLW